MSTRLLLLYPVLALVLVACGRSAPPPAPPEAAQLRGLTGTLAASVEAYRAQAASMESSAACRAARAEYEARVGPAIEGLVAVSQAVDPWMRAKGTPEHGDLECEAAALRAEFERHTDIACTSPDLAANRAEAAAHLVVMDRWMALVAARGEEALAPVVKEGAGSGPRCVRFADGSLMFLP